MVNFRNNALSFHVNEPEVRRGAIWRGEIEDCVHQNHVLRVRVERSKVLPEFVLVVINCGHGQAYFRSKTKRSTNLASISSKEVAGLPLPLLPLNHQAELLQKLKKSVSDTAAKRAKAETVRATAWKTFEAALFDAKDQYPSEQMSPS